MSYRAQFSRTTDQSASRRAFFAAVALTLAFRAWLSVVMPITGDEAYFIWWGKTPDWGFYDHPPMIGWWLAALLHVSDAPWVLRLPVVFLPTFLALGTVAALRAWRVADPWLGGLLVALLPANVWNVLVTTDTPLVYFSFLSGLAFLRAARADDLRWYALSGAMLGLAFLSKYFAVLLGLAYAVYALWRPTRRRWRGLLMLVLAALPAAVLNAWWNWGHCWANIMFNLYNRHENAGLSWRTPLLYLVMMAYLLTPPLLLALLRAGRGVRTVGADARLRALGCIVWVPLAAFALLSLAKTIGLHWVLSFLPFAVLLVVPRTEPMRLRRAARFMAGFALLHVIAIVAVSQLPMETWKHTRYYDGIVLTADAQGLLAALAPYGKDYVFTADGYSPAVTLAYNARRYFPVFGEGSSHARHDDILTDFRRLAGGNILVLKKSEPQRQQYDPYFRSVEYREFTLRGAHFYLVLGHGFNYAAYREGVLDKVRQRYYAIPGYLPPGRCYFCERYFPERPCRR